MSDFADRIGRPIVRKSIFLFCLPVKASVVSLPHTCNGRWCLILLMFFERVLSNECLHGTFERRHHQLYMMARDGLERP